MGLLDGLNMNDPQTLGLLGAAAQMLQASGPSLMPHSFGQVMGAGVQGLNQGVQTGIDRQKEKMQFDMLTQQVAQATRKNALINSFLEQNMGGGQPQPAPAQDATAAPSGAVMSAGGPAMPGASQPVSVQAPSAPSPQSSGIGFGGLPSSAIAADLAFKNGEHIGDWINDRAKPTDFAKQLIQSGIAQGSPLFNQLMQANVAKSNYVAPVNARPGSIMRDPFNPQKILAFNPHVPDGGMPQFDENGNVTGITPLAGAAEVTQAMSRAGAAGKAAVKPITGYVDGKPVFSNELDAATGGGNANAPRWTGGTLSDADLAKWAVRAGQGDKNAQMVLQAYSNRDSQPLAPSLAPGVEKSILGNVDTMKSDFEGLQAANQSAPTTLRLLDNIKKLAPQAIAGSQADKLAYVNGLLTLGGLSGAKDLATATDLLNKNANMLAINMRLGASGGGSDALQSLAQAANPNSHMQPDAVIKAADEVIGQVKMRQDQYQKLLPYRLKNDYQGYFNTQNDFLKGADPHNYQPDSAPSMSLSDIAETARASGRTTAEVTAAAKAKGYKIGGQ